MAIVCDVAIGHQQVLVPDPRGVVLFLGTAVDGHSFAEDVFVPDLEAGRRSVVADVLRFPADHGAGEEAVSLADRRVAGDRHVRQQLAAVAQGDIGSHVAKRPDFDVLAEMRPEDRLAKVVRF